MSDDQTTDAPDDAPQDAPSDDGTELDAAALRQALAAARKDAAKYRTKAKELEPLAAKAQELEDAGRSDTEKLTERLTDAESRAAAAEQRALRLEVAAEKGLTPTQAKRLVGATRDELEADADDLVASFTGPEPDPSRPPRERLRPGAVPEAEPEEMDPRKLAAQVRR